MFSVASNFDDELPARLAGMEVDELFGSCDAAPVGHGRPRAMIPMLLAVGVPDAIGDSTVGKKTLVLRLGALRASLWYMLAVALAYAALPILVAAGLPLAPALAAASLSPLALWRIWCVRADRALRPESWESFTFWSVAMLILTAAAEIAGFLLR
ncbi:MAG: hypothetical protein ABSF35_21140 [Polyangia bacterium]|jgi:1,4-dihydroxy-2-naphthoate octaprenyltransferase